MLLYYLLIRPLSKTPLSILYGIGAFFAWILRHLIRYRRDIALENIQRALPDRKKKEQQNILNRNYRFLGNLLAEGIRNLGMSRQELHAHIRVNNPELMQRFFDQGKSVVLLASHFENWEYIITAQPDLFPHQAMGIGKPLSQGFLNQKINALRSRFGMKVIHAGNYKDELEGEMAKYPVAVLTLADQSPVPESAYWTNFFNVLTPFPYGPEFMAHRFDMAVVFCDVFQDGKGHYVLQLETLCKSPQGLRYGDIMEAYVERHEAQIQRKPEAWLWTHRRWKHQPPLELEAYHNRQQRLFEEKFG